MGIIRHLFHIRMLGSEFTDKPLLVGVKLFHYSALFCI